MHDDRPFDNMAIFKLWVLGVFWNPVLAQHSITACICQHFKIKQDFRLSRSINYSLAKSNAQGMIFFQIVRLPWRCRSRRRWRRQRRRPTHPRAAVFRRHLQVAAEHRRHQHRRHQRHEVTLKTLTTATPWRHTERSWRRASSSSLLTRSQRRSQRRPSSAKCTRTGC